MKLFVFEGKKREPDIFRAMKQLFFAEDETIEAVYDCDIYALYSQMKDLGEGADVILALREHYQDRDDSPLPEDLKASDCSEIYLFFDFDFQDESRSVELLDAQLKDMLSLFSNETDGGKLYVNYPMVESIAYTKELPDNDYWSYSVCREDCHHFKRLVNEFSFYKNFDFVLKNQNVGTRRNWELLVMQNVAKANYLSNGVLDPHVTDIESISQIKILRGQEKGYTLCNPCRVSVLNSFPLFLYEYYGNKILREGSQA